MIFKESTHQYLNEEVPYTSMTSLLKKVKEQKDWDAIAAAYLEKHSKKTPYDKYMIQKAILTDVAKKKEITLEQATERWGTEGLPSVKWVRKIWKDNSEDALARGSAYHLERELAIINDPDVVYNPLVSDQKSSFDLNDLKPGFRYPELICYSHKYKLAGQADLITITDNGKVIIRDFKTSKTIYTEPTAFYNKNLKRKVVEYFNSPLSHLPYFNLNEYALQLSGYAYMLELYGFPPLVDDQGRTALIIEHIIFNKHGVVTGTKDYYVPYLKEEIKALFNYHLYDR